MYREIIEAYFADKEAELTAAASRLIAIPSASGEPRPGMPSGEGPARALAEALAMAEGYGLVTRNVEGHVGTADLNDRETALHILVHLDVVDGGDGWTVTGPFQPKVADGLLYGRGASDDKGPATAALFAMRAVKALGLPLRRNARLIFGTNEENGCDDVAYYYSKHPFAPYTFSPDAEFPLIHIEKGQYRPVFSTSWAPETALPRVTAVQGGLRLNVIPAQAGAEVAGLTAAQLKPYCVRTEERTGVSFSLSEEGERVRLLAAGVNGHAAEPEKGNNALTALLELLSVLPLADCGSTRAVRGLAELFPHGDYYGKALGIAQSDELSGPLTVSFTRLTLDGSGASGQFDSRTALCATEESCRLAAERALEKHGFAVTGTPGMKPPHHTPASSPFVRTLLGCYEAYTGSKGECMAIGGMTYVHDIPGGVAFGCNMPDFISNMHGPDERARISDLMLSSKIFTQAILELCI